MEWLFLLTETAEDFAGELPRGKFIETKSFPDGESYVRVPTMCAGKDVLIIHRCWPEPNENIMKLFLIIDAVRSQKPSSLRVFVPYLPYARMDKAVKPGEAISADTICKTLKLLGCDELITIDVHFIKKGMGTYEWAGLRIRNLSAGSALLAYLKAKAPNAVFVTPDVGAGYLVAKEKGARVMRKRRGGYVRGKEAYRRIERMEASFDVIGRDVILIDDMISTGSTMIKAVELLKKAGARRVFCAAAHGLFLGDSLSRLTSAGADEVIATDSIRSPVAKIKVAKLLEGVL